MNFEHDIFSGLGNKKGKLQTTAGLDDAEAGSEPNSGKRGGALQGDETNPNVIAALDGITIIPVLGDVHTLSKKKYRGRFDFAFLSQHAAHWLRNQEFKSALSNQAVVEVETGKFVYQLKEKDQLQLLEKINSLAMANGFQKAESDACACEKVNELDCKTLRFQKV